MKHHHKHFKDRAVDLDGNEFVDCSFERCRLMYSAAGREAARGPRAPRFWRAQENRARLNHP
jgi:hypothetical protein